MQFRRNCTSCDIFVVRRQLISREAERTYPNTGSNVNLTAPELEVQWQMHVPGNDMTRGSMAIIADRVRRSRRETYQNGFNTDRQGCLQVTGSNWRRGVSGFSFNGVYNAPIGTTRRDASYDRMNEVSNVKRKAFETLTMRELGNTFQLNRTPSLSSTSLHCSFRVS